MEVYMSHRIKNVNVIVNLYTQTQEKLRIFCGRNKTNQDYEIQYKNSWGKKYYYFF